MEPSAMKLHLGCGDIRLDGWHNIDVRRTPAVDSVCNLHDLSTVCGDGQADAVYACHVLEHFGFGVCQPTASQVLAHWVSRLRPGGTCFISVPDLKAVGLAIAHEQDGFRQYDFMRCLYGGCEYPTNRHFIGYTRDLLTAEMTFAGLRQIQTFEPFAFDTSRFVLHGCAVSLNLKGTKP
jgi:predicted SAM-dependent methyltransferase